MRFITSILVSPLTSTHRTLALVGWTRFYKSFRGECMRLRMTVVLMAALCCGIANAQMGAGPSAAEVGKPMEPSKALDVMLTQLENDVVPAAKAMPADKYGFAPSAPGVFAEKSS